MKTGTCTRRRFLSRSTIATAGALAGTRAAAYARTLGANDRIRLGFIGTGGRGRSMIIEVGTLARQEGVNVEITAVCDLWKVAREAGAADVTRLVGGTPKQFARPEELLARTDIDGVVIATPDFWHVPQLLAAVKAGKDVYIEKPLAWSLDEAKAARNAVKASDRVVQVGTQGRSSPARFAAREFIRAGRLGRVSTATAAANDCGPRWRREDTCAEIKAADFEWEYYLADRPKRPFNPRQAVEWRLFWEFSTGPAGLLGSHMFDATQFVLDAPLPATATANGGVYLWPDGRETPDTFMALIEYPRKCLLHYTTRLGNDSGYGLHLFGTAGMLDAHSTEYKGLGGRGPDKLPDEPQKLAFDPPGPYPHMRNFLDCMRSRKTPLGSIDAGYQHTITMLLANESFKTGRKMRYDEQKERIVPA
ncbi:MAG: dehydrogenase [Phycisphaerae bacterium]